MKEVRQSSLYWWPLAEGDKLAAVAMAVREQKPVYIVQYRAECGLRNELVVGSRYRAPLCLPVAIVYPVLNEEESCPQ